MTNISFFHNIYYHFFSFHAISAFLHFLINLVWDNDGTESVKEEWLCICFQAYENEEKWSKVLTMSLIHFFSVCYCRLCFRNVSVYTNKELGNCFGDATFQLKLVILLFFLFKLHLYNTRRQFFSLWLLWYTKDKERTINTTYGSLIVCIKEVYSKGFITIFRNHRKSIDKSFTLLLHQIWQELINLTTI